MFLLVVITSLTEKVKKKIKLKIGNVRYVLQDLVVYSIHDLAVFQFLVNFFND